jgi:O-acetyl-ADP-ribose deacetylase (regulator of RNase III)
MQTTINYSYSIKRGHMDLKMIKILSIILTVSFCCCFISCGKYNLASNIATRNGNKDERATPRLEKVIGTTTIVLLEGGDITTLTNVGAIVNAANEGLRRGGGVCGAIYSAAGYGLDSETNALSLFPGSNVKCPQGYAVITGAHNLSRNGINYIIHAVGSIVHGKNPTHNDEKVLESAYTSSLRLAADKGVYKIAFPCISTAIFGYPGDKAAPIAFNAVLQYIQANPGKFDEIIFVCYRGGGRSLDYWYYRNLLETLS